MLSRLNAGTRCFTVLALAAASAIGQEFIPLGGLGEITDSYAYDISADGSTVIGNSRSPEGIEAFRWTREGGMIGLGDLPGGEFRSGAYGVNGDGSVVVGRSETHRYWDWDGWVTHEEAFRWTQEDGMVGLGYLPGGSWYSGAQGVSSDGSVIVGISGSINGDSEAFRWTREDGMVGLGDLPGERFQSWARGVSGDGLVVVGMGSPNIGGEAFRWTQEDGMVGLGLLPGGISGSQSFATNADGSVVVGYSYSENGRETFRWTQDDGMIGLGDLPGGRFFSWAFAVNADGSVVVGSSETVDFISDAFLWTEADEMRSLKEIIELDYGIDLDGWRLESARGISADGLSVAGTGKNPEGRWEAYLFHFPGRGDCPADFNGDGEVNGADFLIFLNYYFNNDPRGDLTGDGQVNGADFLKFLEYYFEGC